jgi:hypothetical protein
MLYRITYPWHRNGFRVNVAFRQTNFTNTQVIKADRAFIIELEHCNVINGGMTLEFMMLSGDKSLS